MRATTTAVVALALLWASGCAPVRAESAWEGPGAPGAYEEVPYEPEEAPEPGAWEEELAPHGTWYDDARYGPVWRPHVVAGWRPYVEGHWVWTSYGWTWVSYEPWAWTLHYGRWVLLPAHGWVWVPGTVWGPAWVDWYYGDGWVGWAPLPAFGIHVSLFDHFVFVHERDFCAPRLHHRVVHHDHVSDHVRRHWRDRDHRPPRRDRVERVSRHRVERVAGRPGHTLAPWRERREHADRDVTRWGRRGPATGRRDADVTRRSRGHDLDDDRRGRAGTGTVRPASRERERVVERPAPRARTSFDRDDARAPRQWANPGWGTSRRAPGRTKAPETRTRAPAVQGGDRGAHRALGAAWSRGRSAPAAPGRSGVSRPSTTGSRGGGGSAGGMRGGGASGARGSADGRGGGSSGSGGRS